MLAVLSPAKALDFDTPLPAGLGHTRPAFAAEAATLADLARAQGPAGLKALMSLSDALADLNAARFAAFGHPRPGETARQAVLAFAGDTYVGLDAASLSAADLAFAQDHVRILSGLYGVLRPLDLIEPYRLEMGVRLANPRGKDLYAFWKGRIAPALAEAVAGHRHPVIVACASDEYFRAAEEKALGMPVLHCRFEEEEPDGRARVISFNAKRARGMMARFMVANRLEDPADLRAFDLGGYRFRPARSDGRVLVFGRPRRAAGQEAMAAE